MFVEHKNRPGGEGGGGGSRGIILLDIDPIQEVNFDGQGRRKMLCVKKLKNNSTHAKLENVPISQAAIVISDFSLTPLEKVEAALLRSLLENVKTEIRDGEGEYIDRLRGQFRTLFSEDDIEFSSEEMG